mgnify:CR=1 FL=1
MLAVAEQNLLPLDVESALWPRFIETRHGDVGAARSTRPTRATARWRPSAWWSRQPDASLSSNTFSAPRSRSCGIRLERYWKELRIALPIAVNSRRCSIAALTWRRSA